MPNTAEIDYIDVTPGSWLFGAELIPLIAIKLLEILIQMHPLAIDVAESLHFDAFFDKSCSNCS